MSDFSSQRSRLSRQSLRLLWRIQQRFDVIRQTHLLCGRAFEFVRVKNPDTVLDQVVAEEDRRDKLNGKRRDSDELHLPYWAELWDSAFGIGQFLLETPLPDQLRRPVALDLGCGMGFAGMIAAAIGYEVTMADLEPECLLFAQLNAPTARTRRLDWREDRLSRRFDLIIGADVLYDRKQWVALEAFWRHHLAEDGRVLLGEPGRQTGDLFVGWIADKPWRVTRFSQAVATREVPIRLFCLERG
jgi:predicted nicotinamide N-methyase